MLAALHLAEDAFALHLSLQRLEGLLDIVVADENLHAVLLFNPTVDVPNSGGAWTMGADMRHRSFDAYTAQCVADENYPPDFFRPSSSACNSLATIRLDRTFCPNRNCEWMYCGQKISLAKADRFGFGRIGV
jgi:hypothetical protein